MPPKKSRVAVAKAQKNTKTKKPLTVEKILNELEKLYPGISDNRIMAQLVEKLKPPTPLPSPDPTWGKEVMRRCIANFYLMKVDNLSKVIETIPGTNKTRRVRNDSIGREVYKPKDDESRKIGLFACYKCLTSSTRRYVDFVIL